MWGHKHTEYGRRALIGGAAAGLAGAVFYGVRALRRGRRAADPTDGAADELDRLEDRTVQMLRDDPRTDGLEIEVAAVAPGVVELSGRVRTVEEAHDAVMIAQRVSGTSAVLNRLTVTALESQLARTRERYEDGAAELSERQWYGMRVGMGRRRQAPATDPARRDDRVRMIERELEPDAIEAAREIER